MWLCYEASVYVTCVYPKVAALKRIKWKYLFAFSFLDPGGMACCCGMAMNIWMQMMIPLFVFQLLMPAGKARDVRVQEWLG